MSHARPHAISRRQLRWANGVGFALTFFFAAWVVILLLALARVRFAHVVAPMPPAFLLVGALSLLATFAFLGIVLFGFAWRGADLSDARPRHYLFAWTCAGALFALSQSVALVRHGAAAFPHLPPWYANLYWYMCAVAAAVFLLLMWVNADGHRIADAEDFDEDLDDAADEDSWDEAPVADEPSAY